MTYRTIQENEYIIRILPQTVGLLLILDIRQKKIRVRYELF
jgi:hypothetical protein